MLTWFQPFRGGLEARFNRDFWRLFASKVLGLNKLQYHDKTHLTISFPGWGRLGWGDTNAFYNNSINHLAGSKIEIYQMLLLNTAGLEGVVLSSLYSFINKLLGLVFIFEHHPPKSSHKGGLYAEY